MLHILRSEPDFSHFYSTSALDSQPMGQTSTTQGTEPGGLICFEHKLWSTSTSWPSSGRTHETPRLASPGPHTAEHSPGSDTRHLETHIGYFIFTPEMLHILWSTVQWLYTWLDRAAGYIFPQYLELYQEGIQNQEPSPRQPCVSGHILQDAFSLLHHKRRYKAQTSPHPTCKTVNYSWVPICAELHVHVSPRGAEDRVWS